MHHLRDLAVTDANADSQEKNFAAELRSQAAAQEFTLSRLPHPFSTIVTTRGGVAIQDDAILAIDHVLLQMLRRIETVVNRHRPLAIGATLRRWHIDVPIVLHWCLSEPAGMAHRGTAFLSGFGTACCRCGRAGLLVVFPPIRGEFVLPLELQLEFDQSQLLLQSLVFFKESRIPFPLRVDGSMQLPKVELIVIRSVHERTDGRTAQMGAVADIRATLFKFWVEHK